VTGRFKRIEQPFCGVKLALFKPDTRHQSALKNIAVGAL
jgi:hypothetical protein